MMLPARCMDGAGPGVEAAGMAGAAGVCEEAQLAKELLLGAEKGDVLAWDAKGADGAAAVREAKGFGVAGTCAGVLRSMLAVR